MIPMEYIFGAGALVGVALYIVFGGDLIPSFSINTSPESNFSAVGLMNLGQTCFFNAVLQALVSCQSFCDWMARESSANGKHCHKNLCDLLHRIINNLKGSRGTDATADTQTLVRLLDEIREHGWVVGQSEQQDAHELFQAIMNLLHSTPESLGRKGVSNPAALEGVELKSNWMAEEDDRVSVIHKYRISQPGPTSVKTPMLGLVASSMTCKRCLFKNSIKYTAFTSLSLHFPPATTYTPYQLDDLLKYYFVSDNVSAVDCENCLERCDFIKEQSIGRMPRCLCLHVQRLGWYGYQEAMKRHDNIKFPSLLDVTCYSQLYKSISSSSAARLLRQPPRLSSRDGHISESHQSSSAGVTDTNISMNGPIKSCNSKDPDDLLKKPHITPVDSNGAAKPSRARSTSFNKSDGRIWYSLVSVIEHRGSEVSGHFVTYRNVSREKGKWLYTSDLDVREVTAEHVHSRPPYMLFYERMDT
ncbi:ubiquitin carboxyl-terminal hydrolase 30-like [Watersipora subatra]|uniref:ubiquitin carboxyl-terminal hydrolase 30-like n=1 Tax=Watersipora subatra TaxID=2589382 RepID=UPI00355C9E11